MSNNVVEAPRVELKPSAIIKTSRTLAERIGNRFPEASLCRQAERLVTLAERADVRMAEITRPIWRIRALYVVLGIAVVVGLIAAPRNISTNTQDRDLLDWIEILEAGINDIVLLGAGLVFLATLEGRVKRRRTLRELHQIRSFAHVIDMHQLTKDPHRVVGARDDGVVTPIEIELTPYQLSRYLDYCSELLAISGKVAALYVQQFDDQVVLESVTEIETLTTGLSRKIWQKMMVLLEAYPDAVGPSVEETAAAAVASIGRRPDEPEFDDAAADGLDADGAD